MQQVQTLFETAGRGLLLTIDFDSDQWRWRHAIEAVVQVDRCRVSPGDGLLQTLLGDMDAVGTAEAWQHFEIHIQNLDADSAVCTDAADIQRHVRLCAFQIERSRYAGRNLAVGIVPAEAVVGGVVAHKHLQAAHPIPRPCRAPHALRAG